MLLVSTIFWILSIIVLLKYILFDVNVSKISFFLPFLNVSNNSSLNVSDKGMVLSFAILILYNGGIKLCQLVIDNSSGINSSLFNIKYSLFFERVQ